MIVYGDHSRVEDPREKLGRLRALWTAAAQAPAGVTRHAQLVEAFIEAGELLQGLADAAFEPRQCDHSTAAQDDATGLLMAAAAAVARSWRSGFEEIDAPPAPHEFVGLPATIRTRQGEGYAYYQLYPEAYLEAAAEIDWPKPPVVIGLRSIGTGLAAMVATATGATGPVTLRPFGPPFRRHVRLSPELRARLFADPEAVFAVVDEGPGLSGSSFGAVGDLLADAGVEPERIVYFPSHEHGPGPEASAPHRWRWQQARLAPADSAAVAAQVAHWVTDLVGEIEDGELVDGQRLLTTGRGRFVLRFAGLGRAGREKLARAQALHAAGFTAEPLGLRHGFLVERQETGRPATRAETLDRLPDYLAFRARALPAGRGATGEKLIEMTVVNVGEALGRAAEARRRLAALPSLGARPVHVDGRLHAWTWLTLPDGRVLKTEALDHSVGHDLIGPQDIAWDVAGAVVEHGLERQETARLIAATGTDPRLVAAYGLVYPAFQLGLWSFAARADLVRRYADHLQHELERSECALPS